MRHKTHKDQYYTILKDMSRFAILITFLALAGCTPPQTPALIESTQGKERVEDTLEWKQARYQCLKESETHYIGVGCGLFIAKAQVEKVQKEKYTACIGAHGY